MQGSSQEQKLGNDEQRAAAESDMPFKISKFPPTISDSSDLGKEELSELINNYQTRKFEEDILASEALGGKLIQRMTHTFFRHRGTSGEDLRGPKVRLDRRGLP